MIKNLFYSLLLFVILSLPQIALKAELPAWPGMMMACLIILFLGLIKRIRIKFNLISNLFTILFFISIILTIINSFYYNAFDYERFYLTAVLMLLIIYFSKYFSDLILLSDGDSIRKLFILMLRIIIFNGFFSVILIIITGDIGYRLYTLQTEPSHYGIALAPLLLFGILCDKKRAYFYLVITLMLGLLFPNFTIVIAAVLASLVILPPRAALVFLTALTLVYLTAGEDYLSYFISRIDLDGDEANLSNLVFLSGWERAQISLWDTGFMGYGLNQLGIVGSFGYYQSVLLSMGQPDLNLLDGGTLAAKAIAEFGIFGIFFAGYHLFLLFLLIPVLRKYYRNELNLSPSVLLFSSYIVMFSIPMYFRGTGYISTEFIFYMISIFGLYSCKQKIKYPRANFGSA